MNASGLVTPCCLRLGGMKTVLCFVRTLVLVNKLELIRKMKLIQALVYSYMEKKSYNSWKNSLPGSQLVQSLTMKSWSYMVGYRNPQT